MSYNCMLFLILVVISGALALPADRTEKDPVSKRPNKNVYYHLNINKDKKLESVSCLTFKEATTGREYYINITSGCYSGIHYQNRVPEQNQHNDVIEDGCFKLYLIVHEFIHVMDFLYNHGADPNRGDMKIVKENIKKRLEEGKDDPIAHKIKLRKRDVRKLNSMIHLPYCLSKPSSR